MKIYSYLIPFIIFFSCEKNISQHGYQRNPEWELADEIYDNEIGKKVFCQLRKERKLQVCESGWDLRSKKKIQVMHCGFFYYEDINIDQARELLLSAANLYLATINENERILSLLETYPFKPENIEIRIFLYNSDRSDPPPEKLQVISMINGILKYKNQSIETGFFTTIYKETYEEARAKINASKSISL